MSPDQFSYTLPALYHRRKHKHLYIYQVVLLVLVLAVVALPFIYVNVSSQAGGIVRSVEENVQVTAVVSGKIIKSNILKNNQAVKKGDTLLVIKSDALQTQQQAKQSLAGDYYAQLQDLQTLTSGGRGLQTAEFQQELADYNRRLQEMNIKQGLATREYNRHKKLYQDGVISDVEFRQKEFDYQSANASLQSLQSSQQSSWQARKRQLQEQIKQMGGDISQLQEQQKDYVIIAPISGVLTHFSGLRSGSYITASQPVAVISPENDLVIESYVSPDDIGLLKLNQAVNYRFNAYNYNQWGMGNGKVTEIDKNITINEQDGSSFFKVYSSLDKPYLELKNGYKGEIKKGMLLNSSFIINRRSLWNLLWDKVDDWVNPIQGAGSSEE